MKPIEVVIAFGCNIGNCEKQIKLALELLKGFVTPKRVSSIIKSKPYGVENQPEFLNGVLIGWTKLSPYKLLKFLKETEKRIGRKERCRWCEREIDLDIIYYGNLQVRFEDLIIPHPDRLNRPFVIKPLLEIEPSFVDPVLCKPLKLLKKF